MDHAGAQLRQSCALVRRTHGAYGQFLEDRTNREIHANFRAWKEYTEAASNLFHANYRNYVREFPLSGTGLIDRRYEEEYRFKNTLRYVIFGPVDMVLDLNLSRRKVQPSMFDETNRLLELNTGFKTGFEGKYNVHRYKLGFSIDGQNQNYPTILFF